MAIIFVLIGFVLGGVFVWVSRRKDFSLQVHKSQGLQKSCPPQKGLQTSAPMKPPSASVQEKSYLEDKMWYEAELNFLFKVNEKLISTLNLREVAQCITEAAYNFLPIERTVFLTWDKQAAKFKLVCAMGWGYQRKEALNIDSNSISGHVIRTRQKLVVFDLPHDHYLNKLKKEEDFLQKAFISVPLIYKDDVLGVLHVCDKKTSQPFTQREVSVVMNIARMGAIALQNARLYEEVSQRAEELKIAYDELKAMQDKLVQSEKLKAIGQLASSVAHEMKNPLAIIAQGVDYLVQITPAQEKETRESLFKIEESLQRAQGVVSSLLDFSRASKLELHPENIEDIVENSLNLVKAELRQIKVIKEIQKDLPKVLVDRSKLIQVFINLFMNAIHSMPKGGNLVIRSFVKDKEEGKEKKLVVEVEDTGTGISEENLKNIFDPFFTTKERGKGTGLGLSVCRNILLMHKGSLEINSQINKGTTATISLNIS